MKRSVGALIAFWVVAGCGVVVSDPGQAEQGQQPEEGPEPGPQPKSGQQPEPARDVKTAGGCACPAEWGAAAEISIDCFCAEFPNECPSYDQLKGTGSPPDSWRPPCTGDSSWQISEQVGCGQRMLSQFGPYGGWTYVYDEQTHALIGVATSSDSGHGACRSSSYIAGVQPTCTEGKICSTCDSTGAACFPACSMEALAHLVFYGVPQLHIEPLDCSGVEAALRPLVTAGCGRITVTEGEASSTFDAASFKAVGVISSNKEGFCGGRWGEAPAACAEQTTCTPCMGAANSCGQ